MSKLQEIYDRCCKSEVQDAWEEGKHPRRDNGQFGSGSGGAKKAAVKPAAKPAASPAPRMSGFQKIGYNVNQAVENVRRNAVSYEDKDFAVPSIIQQSDGSVVISSNDPRIRKQLEQSGFRVKQGWRSMVIPEVY